MRSGVDAPGIGDFPDRQFGGNGGYCVGVQILFDIGKPFKTVAKPNGIHAPN